MLLRHCLSTLYFAALAAHAAPLYSVTVVGPAGSSAAGINAGGAVVGAFPAAGNTHGFVSAGGAFTDLGTLGGPNSFATAINDAGKIVGRANDGAGNMRAFVWVAGVMTDLGTLGGADSRAEGINNRGDIVGSAGLAPGPGAHASAFLLRPGALMQDLGRFEVPDPEGGSSAYDVNEQRKVVGNSVLGPFVPVESPDHAFLYACEEMTDLGTLGGQFSVAYAINKHGKIVGEASTPVLMNNRAFLYQHGAMKNLGTLAGGGFSSARDINDHGVIVGYALQALGLPAWRKAWVYRGGKMRDLNTLIDPAPGWSLHDAGGINNHGQIAATGCLAGLCFALRLDPLPSP
jgi:probable HAF family extracellular repeat protein